MPLCSLVFREVSLEVRLEMDIREIRSNVIWKKNTLDIVSSGWVYAQHWLCECCNLLR